MSGNGTANSAAPSTRNARLLSAAASVNATAAFDGPFCIKNIIGYNARASAVYLKLYDQVASPVSTDTPSHTIYLPASSAFALDLGDGYEFNKGMGYRLTTGSADNDTGALTAADILGLNLMGR